MSKASIINLTYTKQEDKTGSRAYGTVYQNTSGKPIQVTITSYNEISIIAYTGSANPPTTLVAKESANGAADNNFSLTFIVLPNYYYKLERSGTGNITAWIEWS